MLANDHIDLDLRNGEVHALLGENGAGKSTLMSILYGLYHPDEGEISIKGEKVRISSPKEAIERGIGMVHQHFMLIPVMTVAENIVLATEPTKAGIVLDFAGQEARRGDRGAVQLRDRPAARIENISVGQQQRVEILKALYRRADILILDEPTAVLTPQEARALRHPQDAPARRHVDHLHQPQAERGARDRRPHHRPAEGRKIETMPAAGATEEGLAQLMVGREVLLRVDKTPANPGSRCSRSRTCTCSTTALEAVRGVTFDVRAGEIVGIAGVDGNGQTELIEALTGLRPVASGDFRVAGRRLTARARTRSSTPGIGHIPEDRQKRGLVLEFSLAENMALHDFDKPPELAARVAPAEPPDRARERLLKAFDVRGGGPQTPARALSGGNQQKVVVAREVENDPRVLIAAQPTRGLDVGAIEFVHRRLVEERDEGRAVLLASLELEEILSLSDRILVMYEGEVVGEYARRRHGAGARHGDARRYARGGSGRREHGEPTATSTSRREARRRRRSGAPTASRVGIAPAASWRPS